MTEPQGGSDPKVFTTRAELDGDEWVINGEKWFSSHARLRRRSSSCMAVTDPDEPPYQRMSMFIVPTDTPGVEIVRNVGLGYGHAEDEGTHAYVRYNDVRVPGRPPARRARRRRSSSPRPASAADASTTPCAPSAWCSGRST